MNPSGAAHTGHDTRPKLKVELGTYNGGGDLCNSDVELLCSTMGGLSGDLQRQYMRRTAILVIGNPPHHPRQRFSVTENL